MEAGVPVASVSTPGPAATLKSVALGGMLVAVLDLTEEIVFVRVAFGTRAFRVPQIIAAALLGEQAFSLGPTSVLLGLMLHLAVAFAVVAVYALVSRRFPSLGQHVLLSGVLYGWGVYLFMNFVVIPLTALPESLKQLHWLGFLNGLFGHALLVGLPTAWAVHRHWGAGGRVSAALDVRG